MKELYSFTVSKEIDSKETQVTPEGTLIKDVKKNKDFIIVIKKPSQQEINESSIEYTIKYNELISKGILPVSLMSKFIKENGGIFTDKELTQRDEYSLELAEKSQNYIKLFSKKDKIEEDKILMKEMEKRIDYLAEVLQDFKNREESAYNNTAEVQAKNYIIIWWFLNLMYQKDNNNYIPLFGRSNVFKDKENKLYELEESDPEFYGKIIEKASRLIAMWYTGSISTPEEFLDVDTRLFSDAKEEIELEDQPEFDFENDLKENVESKKD